MKYERKRKEARERKKFEPIREKNEREEREKREEREWYEKRKQYQINELKKEFAYMEFVYGVKMKNRKLAHMNSDEWEIYKARKYVANENSKGHECYNAVEGKKLWINREAWRMRHER